MSLTPPLIWAQRREKVFVTFECLGAENVNVTFADGLLSLDAKVKDKQYKLENLPLWTEIEAEESKWFRNDRCAPWRGTRPWRPPAKPQRELEKCPRRRRRRSLPRSL